MKIANLVRMYAYISNHHILSPVFHNYRLLWDAPGFHFHSNSICELGPLKKPATALFLNYNPC